MTGPEQDVTTYIRRHLTFGWWSLLVFLTLGIGLETLHGFKVAWYLNVGMETRRLLWRLAHAHGTFLGLVHVALAMSIHLTGVVSPAPRRAEQTASSRPRRRPDKAPNPSTPAPRHVARWHQVASPLLIGASVALPGGFFLGGLSVRDGDPGLGIILLPMGVLLLFIAVFVTARGVTVAVRDT